MNKILITVLAGTVALSLASCASDNPGAGAASGAGVSKNKGRGALIGGAIGAAGGAAVGAATTPRREPEPEYDGYGGGQRQCAQVGYDSYGNRVCTAYY